MTNNADSQRGDHAQLQATDIAVTDPTITPPPEDNKHHPSRRAWPLRAAAVGYSVAWIGGLLLVSSSTNVTSSGSAILREDAPHVAALTLQFVLTEGVAALALLVVVIGFWSAIARGWLRGFALVAGAGAVAVSLCQTVLGICLVMIAVRGADASLASALTAILNELDGIKMGLLAVMVLAVAAAQWRRRVRLPFWLLPTGIATGVALVVSAIGYLTSSNTLSVAAWASLPLLLICITGTGLCMLPGSQR